MSYLEEKKRIEALLRHAELFSGDSNKADERINKLHEDLAELERSQEIKVTKDIPRVNRKVPKCVEERPLVVRDILSAKYGVPYTNRTEWDKYRRRFPLFGDLKVRFIFHRTIRLEDEEFEVIVWREKNGEDKSYKAFFNTSLLLERNKKVSWTDLTKEELISGSIFIGKDIDDMISKLNSSDFAIYDYFTVDIPNLRKTLLDGFQAVMKYPNEL